MDIRSLTALELGGKIKDRELGTEEVAKAYLDAVKEEDEAVHAYITVTEERAIKQAREVQKKLDRGELAGSLAGVPVAVKDNICIDGIKTTAGSRMLEEFVPPYTAAAVELLEEAGAVVLGKANMDEFAMGGSTETSYFGQTKNPWDLTRVPGGSSGGSAAAVAAGLAPYTLGSDTGGSIRQPCAFCGLTGIKPTYGSVSRYGLLAYASSLDQIGPIGKDIRDCAAVLSMISVPDRRDSTSVLKEKQTFEQAAGMAENGLNGKRIALPKNYFGSGLDREVRDRILEAAKSFEQLGAEIVEIELPTVDCAVPAYYIIACAEASSNLSRYDGIKYGHRSAQAKDLKSIFYKSRSEGFGEEVKRRILLGSFVLSSGYFDAYYKKALQVRSLIKDAFEQVLSQCDMILSPVSPTTAYRLGEQIADPVAMYMADIYTVSVNLTGMPSVALPCGFDQEGLPIGMQLIGNAFTESALIQAAAAYQSVTDFHKHTAKGVSK